MRSGTAMLQNGWPRKPDEEHLFLCEFSSNINQNLVSDASVVLGALFM